MSGPRYNFQGEPWPNPETQPGELLRLKSLVLRGQELHPQGSIAALSAYVERTDPLHVCLLSQCIPHKYSYGHILFLGTTDAGKSTGIGQLLRDFLWHVGRGYGHRLFIWDYKRTARTYLEALPLKVPVYYLDPIDRRSHGIDWPREIDTDFAAKEFSKAVVHPKADPGSHNHVFVANARIILYLVIRTFQKRAPGKWTLTDVVKACSSEENLKRVLDQTPAGKAKWKTTLGAKGQRAGVFFSLEEFASDFGPIAAALEKIPPGRRLSIREWAKSESVLVLGHFERYPEAMAGFQRWVFSTVCREVLSGPDIAHDGKERTSLFLDEVRNSPFRGEDLTKLLNSGRSKGAVAVAGLGDIAGLEDAIGEKKASEFLGMFKTKVFMRLDGDAAGWAEEKYFRKHLRMIRKYTEGESLADAYGITDNWDPRNGRSQGSSQTSTKTPSFSMAYESVERPVVMAGDFQRLPAPRFEGQNGLVVRAYMVVQELAWKECATHMDQAGIERLKGIEPPKDGGEMDEASMRRRGHVVVTDERPNEDFDCDDIEWDESDLQRLGLPKEGAATNSEPAGGAQAAPAGEKSVFERAFRPEVDPTPPGQAVDEVDEDDDEEDLGLWLDEGEGYRPY